MSKREHKSRGYVVARVLVGLLGFTLSLVLHELFHIVMHWGQVTHVNFFPSPWTAIQVDTAIPAGYDLEGEEIAAYGITLLVILITTVIIFRIKDSEDNRSASQILFPHDKDMQKLSPSEMLELADMDSLNPATQPTVHAAKRRR